MSEKGLKDSLLADGLDLIIVPDAFVDSAIVDGAGRGRERLDVQTRIA